MNTPKICIACGAAFKRSPSDVTVRCPDCRSGRTRDVAPCVVCNDERFVTYGPSAVDRTYSTVPCHRCNPA